MRIPIRSREDSGNCGAGERTPHVLKPIFVVAACIFALMLVVKDGRVLKPTGLTSTCPDRKGVVSGKWVGPGGSRTV